MSASWRRAVLDLIVLLNELTVLIQIVPGILPLGLNLGQRPAYHGREMRSDRGFPPTDSAIAVIACKHLVDGVLVRQQLGLRRTLHLVHAAILIEQGLHVGKPTFHGLAPCVVDEPEPTHGLELTT